MATSFWYTHLWVNNRSWQASWSLRHDDLTRELAHGGVKVWGLFSGLFGLPSNELIAITLGPADVDPPSFAALASEVRERRLLTPTARPVPPFAPLSRPGLYVLRTFELASRKPADIDEIVQLSAEAWTTFETDDEWESEPVGLFTSVDGRQPVDRMLLVTWYDGFGSWERSRTPDPVAQERFVRRHMLTNGTSAIATSLVPLT